MKKLLNTIKTVFTWIVVVVSVGMMVFTIVSVNTFDRSDRNLFGYKAFIVLSDSMSATDFSAGDLVLSKQVDPSTLQPGDIITFSSQNASSFGEIITHKIRALTTDENGDPAFITYGTTTDTDDDTPVTYPFILGKYQTSIPKIGLFFKFLKTVPGYICCILVPFLILIILQFINFIKIFRAYKREQLEDLQNERQALEEERRQSAEMMNELLALKAQLANQLADSQQSAAQSAEPQPAEASVPQQEKASAESAVQ